MKSVKNKSHLIFALVAVFSIFVGISCIAACDVNNNATIDDGSNVVVADNVLEPKDSSHSGLILDGNNDFTMSVRYNSGTGYHWEVSPESYGVDVSEPNYVQDHPGLCGTSGTAYFNVHVNSDNYYVKLVLVSPSGKIVDEVDSDMIN